MQKRFTWCIYSITALLLGFLDYILYRQDTYIGALSIFPAIPHHWGYNFFAYYFPDFLWAFSLSFGLFAVLAPEKHKTTLCFLLTVTYGSLWEFCQHHGWISGTADFVDLCMYVAAASAAVIIKYTILRRK